MLLSSRPTPAPVGRPLAAAALALVALLAAGRPTHAQGTLGAQGLGYPPGQVSTSALATGGATAEFDALSPLNEAAMLSSPATTIHFQYAPEMRETSLGDASSSSTVQRFPVFGIVGRVGARLALGVHASTLLDRSWATVSSGQFMSNGAVVAYRDEVTSTGAITDVRAAAAWRLAPRLGVGLGVHVYTGENRTEVVETFSDPAFTSFVQRTLVDYNGASLSGGVNWAPVRQLALAASGRAGGTLRMNSGAGTKLSSASVPTRAAAAAQYSGITGAVLAVRGEWQGWSSLDDLGTEDGLDARDTWDLGVGADVAGPRIGNSAVALRAGARLRDLPFAVDGSSVRETSFSGGLGLTLARGRVLLDFAAQRASRDGPADASETGWTFSSGIAIRP
ncbi:MAG TPA: hypothetical protein VHQ45_05680 [Gemmatimonadaceae bacterium]|nr:hypothetical protein [Gemmatimonadaceae bacterium]